MNTITLRNDGDYSFVITHCAAFDFRGTTPQKFVRGRLGTGRFYLCVEGQPDTPTPPDWQDPVYAAVSDIIRAHRPKGRGHTINEDGKRV